MAHHHHRKEEEGYGGEDSPQYGGDSSATYFPQSPDVNPSEGYGRETYSDQQVNQDYSRNQSDYPNYEQEMKTEKRREHDGEAAALGAGAFALHERHEEKEDPEHARAHKIEEELAEAGGVGSTGYSLYEHRDKKNEHREEEEAEGKKHHIF